MKKKYLALLLTGILLFSQAAVRAEELPDLSWILDPEATLPPADTFSMPVYEGDPDQDFIMAFATETPKTTWIESEIEDDGIVRVRLLSLGTPEKLTLILDGVYTVDGNAAMSFSAGTRVTLTAEGECVFLSCGGMRVNMGPALTLTRQASWLEHSGIEIEETGRTNLYEGDLSVSVLETGGLNCILSIDIESYLMGVIAYEMGDAWPLEALKAQAVAARSYAMQRKNVSARRDYDLMDTTADQVFRGYNEEYKNVEQAVRETEGIVCTWENAVALLYYSASNGGETALPQDVWKSSPVAYLDRRSDPYDLENPLSVVRSVSFSYDVSDCPVLEEMLLEHLRKQYPDCSGFVIDEIRSITPMEPDPADSSRYTVLRFELDLRCEETVYTASDTDCGAPHGPTDDPSADLFLSGLDYIYRMLHISPYIETVRPAGETITASVDLDVYSEIRDSLGLGINSQNYELISVTEEYDTWTIETRRFGHGIGMSQRGAQRMAGKYDMTWNEILLFYYPGITLERIHWNTPEAQYLEYMNDSVPRALPTPLPTARPLRSLNSGEYYARVQLDAGSSVLNLRQQPGTYAAILTQLPNKTRLIVTSRPDADGWVSVETDDLSGYVKLEYLNAE